MDSHKQQQGTTDDDLTAWIAAFIRSRQAMGVSTGTIHYYNVKFTNLERFAQDNQIQGIGQLTADALRLFLATLAEQHAPGDVHAHYRSLRALMNFYADEAEPPGWRNPMARISPPKTPATLLDPVELSTVHALIAACDRTIAGLRDHAALLVLIDSGVRAQELLDLNRTDVNLITGDVLVRLGKGSKDRHVYIGRNTRRSLRRYLRARTDSSPPLIATVSGDRLSYWGLRDLMERRSKAAGIPTPSLHSFRRAFALNCLRAGMDVYTLQRLMGHADFQTLNRYIKLSEDDLAASHARYSPGDKLD